MDKLGTPAYNTRSKASMATEPNTNVVPPSESETTILGPMGHSTQIELESEAMTDSEDSLNMSADTHLTGVIEDISVMVQDPSHKVDENMNKAQKRSSVREEVFWFRKKILPPTNLEILEECEIDEEYGAMTIDAIVNGKVGVFPGLIPLINNYLQSMDVDADTHCTVQQYLNLIQKRASGELLTTASWIRQFVRQHPSYKQDSYVNEDINYDLLKEIERIQDGLKACPELLGQKLESKTKGDVPTTLLKPNVGDCCETPDAQEEEEDP